MKTCQHCQQPMLSHKCDQCFGTGYLWARDEVGDVPVDCPTCGGCGEEHHCTNTDCPGIVWYSLSRDDSAILRRLRVKIGEDGR